MFKAVLKPIRQCIRWILPVAGICFLCGFMVKTSPGEKSLQILQLPPEYSPSEGDLFAWNGVRSFYFFNPENSSDLWELSLFRPMESPYFLGESWLRIPLPDLRSIHHVRDMAFARNMLFIAGLDENQTPIVRSYLLSAGSEEHRSVKVLAHTDYYPPSGGSPVRKFYYDHLTRVLWLLYDNGQVQVGPHMLALPGMLLTDAPAGYLMLPGKGKPVQGPRLLPHTKRAKEIGECLSCPLSVLSRTDTGEDIVTDHPVHLPSSVRTHLGIWPMGQQSVLFRDKDSYACRIPERNLPKTLHPCLRVPTGDLPLASLLTGNWLVILTNPDDRSRQHILLINAAYIDARIRQGAPLGKGFLGTLVRKEGTDYVLPAGSRLGGGFAVSGPRQAIFIGHRHLYRIPLYRKNGSQKPRILREQRFLP
uniref:Uncharacterized protein n=1 Tax=Leptospirillum ferriphilum TaxID=178606 RepID=A0A7C3LTV0_9BACT